MRYFILFFLFSGLCNAQDEFDDYVKVTTYKIIKEYNDGPCSIVKYLENEGLGYFVKAVESDDTEFAKKLIALKKKLKRHGAHYHVWCQDRCVGCPMVDKMFIIEVNKYRDTILLMEDRYLYSPGDKIMLYDEKAALSKILPEKIKAFFDYDFKKDIERSYIEMDSINETKIAYKNQQLYNCNRKAFEKQFGTFGLITTTIDSLWNDVSISKT